MINKLISLANNLDSAGFYKEAEIVDGVLRSIAAQRPEEEASISLTKDEEGKLTLKESDANLIFEKLFAAYSEVTELNPFDDVDVSEEDPRLAMLKDNMNAAEEALFTASSFAKHIVDNTGG